MLPPTLTDEEKEHLLILFFEEIVPKLKRLHARMGNISCEFAGEQYRKWIIRFHERGSDFDVMDIEYDEEGSGLDLDL